MTQRTSLSHQALTATILSAVSSTLGGCGGVADTGSGEARNVTGPSQETDVNGPEPEGELTRTDAPFVDSCVDGIDGSASTVAGLHPTRVIDYASVSVSLEVDTAPLFQAGVPCASAENYEECATNLSRLEAAAGETALRYRFIVTDADGAHLIENRADLLELLGTIDSFNEASLLLRMDGGRASGCEAWTKVGGAYSYEYESIDSSCIGTSQLINTYRYTVRGDGTYSEETIQNPSYSGCAVPGRLSDHLGGDVPAAYQSASVGEYFSNMCQLETAAVAAFLRMADELRRHGAPQELVDGAIDAASEEVEHARFAFEMALKHGQRPGPIVARKYEERSLFELAMENAVEGCVHELFAAATAHYQACRIDGAHAKQRMLQIADEEVSHAAWSLRLHDFLMSQLNAEERKRVAAAKARAFEQLECDVDVEPAAELVVQAGVPTARDAKQMVKQLEGVLAA